MIVTLKMLSVCDDALIFDACHTLSVTQLAPSRGDAMALRAAPDLQLVAG